MIQDKNPTIKCYTTEHYISKIVMSAFAQGCNGQRVPPTRLLSGDAALYGILRGTGEIIKECEKVGRTYWHLDHGYFNSGHFEGYYRVTKNGQQYIKSGEYSSDRWDKQNIELQPWKKEGSHIVLCPLSRHVAHYLGIDSHKWLKETEAKLKENTDREIVIKPKDDVMSLEQVLHGAHAIVAYNSNALVDAIILGIPGFSTAPFTALPSSTYPLGNTSLDNIENPEYRDREQWVYNLAYQQFTLNEMRTGEAWRILNEET